jgi:bifunctional UDP-N-acetylglucosamine pyrophosphorylase/glucosamine-1-phosphate N-acetyltransferase
MNLQVVIGCHSFSHNPHRIFENLAGVPLLEYSIRHAQNLHPASIGVLIDSKMDSLQKGFIQKFSNSKIPVIFKKNNEVFSWLTSGHGADDLLFVDVGMPLIQSSTLKALQRWHHQEANEGTFLIPQWPHENQFEKSIVAQGNLSKTLDLWDAEGMVNAEHAWGSACFFKKKGLKTILTKKNSNHFSFQMLLKKSRTLELKLGTLTFKEVSEALHVSNGENWSDAHRFLTRQRIKALQQQGVVFWNANTVEIDPEIKIGVQSVIEGGVTLKGKTVIGERCHIGAGSMLVNARLGNNVVVQSSCVVNSMIGNACDVGPYAHVRGESYLYPKVHVGTHAELKHAIVQTGSKIGHFSYVGDAQLGKAVNVGAGCVFANYDGRQKHQTKVGDHVFLGSNSTLVAPLWIGKSALIAAGAVVTKDVLPNNRVAGVPARPMKLNG